MHARSIDARLWPTIDRDTSNFDNPWSLIARPPASISSRPESLAPISPLTPPPPPRTDVFTHAHGISQRKCVRARGSAFYTPRSATIETRVCEKQHGVAAQTAEALVQKAWSISRELFLARRQRRWD